MANVDIPDLTAYTAPLDLTAASIELSVSAVTKKGVVSSILNDGGLARGTAFTAPVSGDFAWKASTQGNAVETDKAWGLNFTASAPGSSPNLRLFGRAVPVSEPWTIDAKLCVMLPIGSSFLGGLYVRDSAGGKILTIANAFGSSTQKISTAKWNSATSFSAGLGTDRVWYSPTVWFRINNDATNYNFLWSANGLNWITHSSIGKTGFLASAADECGLVLDTENVSALAMAMDCYSYSQG